MKKFTFFLTAATVLAIGAGAMAYEGSAVTGGSTISGTVKYDGTAPAPKEIAVTKDKEVCGLIKHVDQGLVVSGDGGIANAVVTITNISKGEEMKPVDAKFDQKGCQYDPHVLAVPVGSTIEVTNSDGILHNIHTYSTKNPPFNMAQPKFKKTIKVTSLEQPEVIKVTCDAHGWMSGWWVVVDNPYYAVTDEHGKFSIQDVPPGDYTVQVWQEKLGKQDQKVSVKSGSNSTANFSMKPQG